MRILINSFIFIIHLDWMVNEVIRFLQLRNVKSACLKLLMMLISIFGSAVYVECWYLRILKIRKARFNRLSYRTLVTTFCSLIICIMILLQISFWINLSIAMNALFVMNQSQLEFRPDHSNTSLSHVKALWFWINKLEVAI